MQFAGDGTTDVRTVGTGANGRDAKCDPGELMVGMCSSGDGQDCNVCDPTKANNFGQTCTKTKQWGAVLCRKLHDESVHLVATGDVWPAAKGTSSPRSTGGTGDDDFVEADWQGACQQSCYNGICNDDCDADVLRHYVVI